MTATAERSMEPDNRKESGDIGSHAASRERTYAGRSDEYDYRNEDLRYRNEDVRGAPTARYDHAGSRSENGRGDRGCYSRICDDWDEDRSVRRPRATQGDNWEEEKHDRRNYS